MRSRGPGIAAGEALGRSLRSFSSCVGHWPLDESSGTTAYDRTANARNGTYTNGPLLGLPVAPGFSSALGDGSDDYVDIADNNAFDFTGTSAFTLHLLLRRTATSAGYARMIGHEGGTNGGWMFCFRSTTGYIAMIRETNDATIDYILNGVRDNRDNRWHQFVVTYDGTTVKLYVDGVLDNSGAQSNSVATSTAVVRLWSHPTLNPSVAGLGGAMAHVAIFNAALTAEQIRTLFQASPLA